MLRTIFVNKGDVISFHDGWLNIEGNDVSGKVPIEDVFSVILDNPRTQISGHALAQMATKSIHVVLCDSKHLPVAVILPLNQHHRPFGVLKQQISLPKKFKDQLWRKIITGKIHNQIRVLQFVKNDSTALETLEQYALQVKLGDSTNREGLAAKIFFREMYGSEFIRLTDDAINAALNYGYAILRSTVSKCLSSFGYNCSLGIHHISETNPFNLADDFMEPLRPLVDYWVDVNRETLIDELTSRHKKSLAILLDQKVIFDHKKTSLRYAIEKYIASLSTAIEANDYDRLLIPEINPLVVYEAEDEK